jgi:hypothetical protein
MKYSTPNRDLNKLVRKNVECLANLGLNEKLKNKLKLRALVRDEDLLEDKGVSKAGMASREMDVEETYSDNEVRLEEKVPGIGRGQ